MSQTVTLGGDRLGSGNKQNIHLHGYGRSTHDLSYAFRSSMASGTLVPFMSELALPGDTFDIDLEADVLTHPTIGPLFGSYKLQLDVFEIPIRLYNGVLHMNLNKIGLDMSKITLPQLQLAGFSPTKGQIIDNQQINPSCIFSYLGIRGIGWSATEEVVSRRFNGVPYLGYFDIYNTYYANKQEEIGYIIHKDVSNPITLTGAVLLDTFPQPAVISVDPLSPSSYTLTGANFQTRMVLTFSELPDVFSLSDITLMIGDGVFPPHTTTADYIWTSYEVDVPTNTITMLGLIDINMFGALEDWLWVQYTGESILNGSPRLVEFPLDNINQMRINILNATTVGSVFEIDGGVSIPYSLPLQEPFDTDKYSMQYGQEGLLIKTYQSDKFNNWIDTEWIDGVDGINAVTAVSTVGDSFTIDELNLSKKVYEMLNRIAVSGGTFYNWIDTVYGTNSRKPIENPIYLGGLSKELVFQEVVSMAATEDQPIGTLAGRGKLSGKHKGGKITYKCNEPSYVMGIVSLTPRIDYSQGNKWDTRLQTMNDLHKPALDAIGFQDLITDQMAWWDTEIVDVLGNDTPVYKSAGKQPAWMDYMTNYNRTYGNFAEQTEQMWMTLNRRYEDTNDTDTFGIKDLTTYIDPVKFNNIFADTRLDAQNFWTQIGVGITARRVMSAKVIPNL